jgi:gliding motility-associated-like protein
MFTVTQVNSSISINSKVDNTTCTANNGSIDITVTGGTLPYNYAWNNGSTSEDIAGLSAGTYHVIVTDAYGCSASADITVQQVNSTLTLSTQVTNTICTANNGSIMLVVTGGTSPYSYTWSNGMSTKDINGLGAANYSVVVSDVNGCSASTQATVLQESTNITLAGNVINSTCLAYDGAIALTIAGGNPPFAINWSGPSGYSSAVKDISDLAPGTYKVIVTDINGCTLDRSFIVSQNKSAITIASTVVNADCNGLNGAIDLSVSNGATPYTYSWTGPAGFKSTDEDLSGLMTGVYTVTVTDNKGCEATEAIRILLSGNIKPTFQKFGPYCPGTIPEALPFTSKEGIKGVWNPSSINTSTNGTTTYTFMPLVGQCADPVIIDVEVSSYKQGVFDPIGPVCKGSASIDLPTTSKNGISGTWYPAVVTTDKSASYLFSPQGGQCAVATNIDVVVVDNITPVFAPIQLCKKQEFYLLPQTSLNGITGKWYPFQVDRSVVGTNDYAFVPDMNQCAVQEYKMQIPVTASLAANESKTICLNQLPFKWNGLSINSAGSYSATLQSAQGCDSIITMKLDVLPALQTIEKNFKCSGQLPFSWNGLTITAAGTYTVTLKSASGCDSTVSLILTVGQPTTSVTDITVCAAQLPYTWNNNQYNTAGTYTVNLQNRQGCDSIATLNLVVAPVIKTTETVSVCPAQLPYSWNNNAYSNAGTYSVTLKNVAGCDSIAVLVLNLSSVASGTTTVAVCPSALPYTWNRLQYNAAGTYSVTLKSQSGCDSIDYLVLSVKQVTASTTSITICESQLPYKWNNNIYSAAGTYSVTLKNQAGCDSVATLILSLNSIVSSSTNKLICQNELPYLWNGKQIKAAGTYSVTLISQSGCDSIASLNLTVNPVPVGTTAINICTKQLPYVWNDYTYEAAGTYSVTIARAAACDSIAVLILSVSNTVVGITETQSICALQLPYKWNGITITTAGTYSTTLTNAAGCDSIATLILTVSPLATAAVKGPSAICSGGTATVTLTLTGTPPWSVNYSDGSSNHTISGITTNTYDFPVSPGSTTTYTLLSVSDFKCTNNSLTISNSVTITVSKPLTPVRYTTVNAVANIPIQLRARDLGSNTKYLWSPGTGLSAIDIIDPIFRYSRPVDYAVKLTDASGCSVIDSVSVKLGAVNAPLPDPQILVPKAWTPNGDGHNDKLVPFLINIRQLNYFKIYNRWGQLVYDTKEMNAGWDGIFNGKPQVMDAYAWVAEGVGVNGKVVKEVGNSILLR